MHSFTVATIDGSYMFRLRSNHYQAVCTRRIKANYAPALHIVTND